VIALEIGSRNVRVPALQDRWSMLRADLATLKTERAAAMPVNNRLSVLNPDTPEAAKYLLHTCQRG
jgi:hypothetical protein